MRVIYIRTNAVDPDPRVEKEISSIAQVEGIKITILAWNRGGKAGEILDQKFDQYDNVNIIRFGIPSVWGGGVKKNLFPLIKFLATIQKWLIDNQANYDVIHACDLFTYLPSRKTIKRFSKDYIYDIYDYFPDTKKFPKPIDFILRKLEHKAIEGAKCTIICTEKREEQIETKNYRELLVVHNSPSERQLRCDLVDYKLNRNRFKLCYVGNLTSERFIVETIDATKDIENIELHIGGMGPLAERIEKIAKENENVFFYGKLDYQNVISLEIQCDAMFAFYDPLINNHKYAAPNKFYEALALGKPLMMFKNTGMDNVLTENGFGVAVECNKTSIKKGAKELVKLCNMSDKEKKFFVEQFSWEIMEKRLMSLYKGLN
ncbi:glycosyltransferase family 4 protein [Blautia sp. JLR.GB0024]|uniref:glycosyltransferase family 4 protein n=1 Tax=Blautia sp. JLR.GB0024 TaxID=3123295 RepID=UPI003006C8F6